MLGQFILITILSNFIINTNCNNPYQDLEKLLQDVSENTHDKREFIQRLKLYQSQQQQRKKPLSNLMSIETLNLFTKPKQRETEVTDLDNFLRTETDRICKETGRCGCSGARCEERAEDEAANDVNELLDEINKQLAIDKNMDVVVDVKEDNKLNKNQGDSYHDDENLLKGKKIKVNDDIDVLVLNPEEMDDLLRKQNFIDLTRNSIILDTDTGRLTSGPKNPEHLRELIEEIIKKEKSSNVKTDKNTNNVTPDDLFKHYETLKNKITNLFAFYIRNNQNEIPMDEHLKDYQLQLLENLKINYQQGNLKDNKIKSEINKVIFGQDSNTKILPHFKNSQNVYIPKQYYDDILKSKTNSARSTQKRILPLTFQQKNRLVTKDKGKIIPKLIWRRNLRQNNQDLGIPFNLEVRGLGQINPNQ